MLESMCANLIENAFLLNMTSNPRRFGTVEKRGGGQACTLVR